MINLRSIIRYDDRPHSEWACEVRSSLCVYMVIKDEEGYIIQAPGARFIYDEADISLPTTDPEASAACLIAALEAGDLEE